MLPPAIYVVYQTRGPAIGRGRLLVPLSNPQTADLLLRIAAAIAIESNYELECLHAIVIPPSSHPAETPVDLITSRQLCDRAAALGKIWGISVHTQVRVTHNIADTILETISDRHINLLCMGWQGKTSHAGKIFGSTVDTLIRTAPCHLMLVKLGAKLTADLPSAALLTPNSSLEALMRLTDLNRWLVPISGGSNVHYALQLLPALTSLSREPEIHLCQIFPTTDRLPDLRDLHTAANFVRQSSDAIVSISTPSADVVATATIDFAIEKQCDVIMLGASREGLLRQTIYGNIPESIARGSSCTVIVVRSPPT